MLCPYCNEEMETGVIQSPHELCWKKKKSVFDRAMFHEGSILLSGLSMLKGSAVTAFCCRKCQKVIIDYKDSGKNMNV